MPLLGYYIFIFSNWHAAITQTQAVNCNSDIYKNRKKINIAVSSQDENTYSHFEKDYI